MGFYFLLWWKICQFYTAAKQRIRCLLFHTVHHWFQAFLTVLSYFEHRDQFLPLWEGEEFDNYAECRSAPLYQHSPAMPKTLWAGICLVLQPSGSPLALHWLFGTANKERIWQRPQTPGGSTDTSTFSNQQLGTQNRLIIHHLTS